VGARERDEAHRRVWHRIVRNIDPRRLRFVDESGANVTLTRRYGWAPINERCHGSAPRNYDQNLTLVASLSLEGIDAPLVLEGAVNSELFALYTTQILCPTLRPRDLVIMDNLSSHKRPPIREAIAAVGARVLFLPSYSPDLNPIEMAFSKIKAYLRRVGTDTEEALVDALTAAIDLVTAADARGYFRHCGYTGA
jgi:transposase